MIDQLADELYEALLKTDVNDKETILYHMRDKLTDAWEFGALVQAEKMQQYFQKNR